MIVDSWGKIIDEIVEPRGVIAYGEIDLTYLQDKRKSIPVIEHMKALKIKMG